MSDILKAADDIVSYASRIRSFLEVADVLKRIGNIEQAEKEAKFKAERAGQEAAAAEKDAEAKKSVVAKLDEEIDYARKSAEEIIAQAKQRAVGIVDEAAVEGQKMLRGVSERRVAFENELKALREKLTLVQSAISEKESTLASIVGKIDEARKKLAEFLK